MECVCPITERLTQVDNTGLGRDSWSLVRCRETGFVFLANPPDYARLEEEFAWEKTWALERKRRDVEEPIVAQVSALAKSAKFFLSPGRNKIASMAFSVTQDRKPTDTINLVDIGCGGGGLMVELHRRFAEAGRKLIPFGVEVSRQLAADSHARAVPLGGRVISASALDGIGSFPPMSIQLATMSSFLEHECRPLSLLRRLHTTLAPEGVVVLKVPNFASWNRLIRRQKWCGLRFPDHVNYFTPETLRILAHEAGFVVYRQNFGDRLPTSDNMYAVLAKATG